MTTAKSIRAVVVQDDSSQRALLLTVLQRDAGIAVIGVASGTSDAVRLVAQTRPDVVILDLHLADGGCGQAVEQLMAETPTAILVLTTPEDERQCPSVAGAMRSGALSALSIPARWTPALTAELHRMVRQISKVPVIRHPRGSRRQVGHATRDPQAGLRPIVAMAASTGGPSALAKILSGLGALAAPVLVVQHLHPEFTNGLLEWMTRASALPVELATAGQNPQPGRVYLAPAARHLCLGVNKRLELRDAPVTIHRPSADQLFESVAQQGASAIGVLLTGMGDDGARGLLAIHQSGGQTLAQDEASSAVFGMPRAAQLLGAVSDLIPLDQLAAAIQRAVARVRV